MKKSTRKRVSLTKLTLARVKYIREHYIQFATHQLSKRQDITNLESMHPDTIVLEAGVEVFFKAMCKALELSPKDVDKIAISEYAVKKTIPDEYLDKLMDVVELEYNAKKIEAITPSDRMKAVEEYKTKTADISDEWGEE